jgi:NADP-dependent 3-hydroxy acid dehydrogenase YdfG
MPGEFNAVITGASSGIGKAIALAIASTGGSVCLVGRNKQRLGDTAKIATRSCARLATARRVFTFLADLSTDRAIEDLVQYINQDFNLLDTLVHCAGFHTVGNHDMPVDQLDALYRINVRTPYVLTQALLPLLKSRKGQIVYINSSQGLQAGANTGAYAATKHALKALADSLRQEINSQGVRVLSIYAGRTATPTQKKLFKIEGRTYRPEILLQPEDIAQIVMNTLQLPRTAEVTNIEIRPLTKSY